jgi:trans-aconitate methyltransferase
MGQDLGAAPAGTETAVVTREEIIRKWTGQAGVERVYNRATKWPDPDTVPILRRLCIGTVCEIGCGTGRIAEAFSPDAYIGLDINLAALAIAKQEKPHHSFRLIDWDDAYPEADTYLFFTVLLHVPDHEVMRLIARTRHRIVVVETMARWLRRAGGEFQRHPEDYEALFARMYKRTTTFVHRPLPGWPHFYNFLVLE